MGAEPHRRGVVDVHTGCGRDILRANEIPGSPDLRLRVEVAVAAHLSTEAAKQERPPGVERARRRAVQQRVAETPHEAAGAVAWCERRAQVWIGCCLGRDLF